MISLLSLFTLSIIIPTAYCQYSDAETYAMFEELARWERKNIKNDPWLKPTEAAKPETTYVYKAQRPGQIDSTNKFDWSNLFKIAIGIGSTVAILSLVALFSCKRRNKNKATTTVTHQASTNANVNVLDPSASRIESQYTSVSYQTAMTNPNYQFVKKYPVQMPFEQQRMISPPPPYECEQY